jgi:hypothetical protein
VWCWNFEVFNYTFVRWPHAGMHYRPSSKAHRRHRQKAHVHSNQPWDFGKYRTVQNNSLYVLTAQLTYLALHLSCSPQTLDPYLKFPHLTADIHNDTSRCTTSRRDLMTPNRHILKVSREYNMDGWFSALLMSE